VARSSSARSAICGGSSSSAGSSSPARTLEGISLALGEYDRDTVSQTLGQTQPQEWLAHPTHSDSVNYHTQRQRVLTPGEIARLPDGHALLLHGADWNTIQLTPWHETEPWKTIAAVVTP